MTGKRGKISLNLPLAVNGAKESDSSVVSVLVRTAVESNMQFLDSFRYVVSDVIQ